MAENKNETRGKKVAFSAGRSAEKTPGIRRVLGEV
jgi:hypothetical protein